jgi:hypothetical protein
VVLGSEQGEVGIPVLSCTQMGERSAHARSRREKARAGVDARVGGIGESPPQRLARGGVDGVVRRLAA